MAAQQESSLAQGRRMSVIEHPLTPLTPLSSSPIPARTTDGRRHSSVYKTYSLPTADRHYLQVPHNERRVSIRRPIRGIDSPLENGNPAFKSRKRRHGVVGSHMGPLSNFRDQTIDDKFNAWIIRNKMTSSMTDSEPDGSEKRAYGVTI